MRRPSGLLSTPILESVPTSSLLRESGNVFRVCGLGLILTHKSYITSRDEISARLAAGAAKLRRVARQWLINDSVSGTARRACDGV